MDFDPLALQIGFPGTTEVIAVFALFFVVSLAVWFLVAYWVYRDAGNAGLDAPVLWAAVVFFVGPIGAVAYLLVRERG